MLSGHEWRNLRVTLTPTFTSGKMKMMFPTIIDVGKQLQILLKDEVNKDESEVKDILARFTIDVIASVAFGIEANSLKNPKVEFRTITEEFSNPSIRVVINQFIMLSSSRLSKLLKVNKKKKIIFSLIYFLVTICTGEHNEILRRHCERNYGISRNEQSEAK